MTKPYLEGLNPEQKICVEAPDGPLLILAGAGTGKTRTLTARIAHLLATGRARGSQILAVTFTNKAAKELRARAENYAGGGGGGGAGGVFLSWAGTFHSMGARILRHHAELVGRRSNFTILDASDQLRLVKDLLKSANIDPARMPPALAHHLIERWKDRALAPDQIPSEEKQAHDGRIIKIYRAYQDQLKNLNAMDFGDLLMECLRLFRDAPEILEQYQNRFSHIFVDEYQDTNVAQYLWLRLLAAREKNLCCVGDDDQSIYGWRGAELGNILRFEKDFPGATIIRLERNYRSTGHILGGASAVISHNGSRLGKTLRAQEGDGDKIRLIRAHDGKDEAQRVCREILTLREKRVSLDEIAILVRSTAQMRSFEEEFLDLALPYRIIGGARFYERAEIRDIIAYLRLIAQPDDDLAFRRIVNVPKRGLGAKSVLCLTQAARDEGASLLDACSLHEDSLKASGVGSGAITKLRAFAATIKRFADHKDALPLETLAEKVMDESGYRRMWAETKTPDAETRLDNLAEMLRACGEFDSLEGYLEHVALVMEIEAEAGGERVSLMTLHAAKGLEFDAVFLPGWEEGLMPHIRALTQDGLRGLEEERRLAHVGMTRARRNLYVGCADMRVIHGFWQDCLPSRFIAEIPQEHVEILPIAQPFGAEPVASAPLFSPSEGGAEEALEEEPSLFSVGARAHHKIFGAGTVSRVEGKKVTVRFDDPPSEKTIMAGFLIRLPDGDSQGSSNFVMTGK